MELTQIKTQTTWGNAVESINNNNAKIALELQKVGEKMVGYYVNLSSLQEAHPIGVTGTFAYVGTTAPFKIYQWSESSNSWIDTGATGGITDVDFSLYLPISGGTITGDVKIQGEAEIQALKIGAHIHPQENYKVSVVGDMDVYTLTADAVIISGGSSDEVLVANGDNKTIEDLGALLSEDTTDEEDYEDVF